MQTQQHRENKIEKINRDVGISGKIIKGLIFMPIESQKKRLKSVVLKTATT